jgi:hypothetical protein
MWSQPCALLPRSCPCSGGTSQGGCGWVPIGCGRSAVSNLGRWHVVNGFPCLRYAEDLRSYLNEQVLRQVWNQLFLPARARRTWEERFPDLRL